MFRVLIWLLFLLILLVCRVDSHGRTARADLCYIMFSQANSPST